MLAHGVAASPGNAGSKRAAAFPAAAAAAEVPVGRKQQQVAASTAAATLKVSKQPGILVSDKCCLSNKCSEVVSI